MFVFTEDAPKYGEDSSESIAEYYDKIISCSKDVPTEHHQYIKYQMHWHSRKGCCVGNTNKCRFGFPVPPMPKTQITEPIHFKNADTEEHYKHLRKKIKKHLDDLGMGDDVQESFQEMIQTLGII